MKRLSLLLLTLAILPGLAFGSDDGCNLNSGVVPADSVSQKPLFLGNQRVAMRGWTPDLFAFAQYIDIPGVVDDNTFAFGQKVTIDGDIGGDLFVFCQTLIVEGEVGGDIWGWTGEIYIEPDATVAGSIYAVGGILQVEGNVAGSVCMGGGMVLIEGSVGSLDLSVGSLELGEYAVVAGDVKYSSTKEAIIDPAARIGGEIVFNLESAAADEGDEEESGFGVWTVLRPLWALVGGLIVGAILLALLGRHFRKPSAAIAKSPGRSLGVGFLVFIATPIAAIIAIALLVTMPLGLVGLALYGVALYVGYLAVSLWLGGFLIGRLGGEGEPGFRHLALGLAILTLVGLVPYLGLLVRVLAAIAGLGGLYLAFTNGKKEAAPAVV